MGQAQPLLAANPRIWKLVSSLETPLPEKAIGFIVIWSLTVVHFSTKQSLNLTEVPLQNVTEIRSIKISPSVDPGSQKTNDRDP